MNFSNSSMTNLGKTLAALAMTMCLISLYAPQRALTQQSLSKKDREEFRGILKRTKNDLEKNYYDQTFSRIGIGLEAYYIATDKKIQEAQTAEQAIYYIGRFLLDLKDPVTFFLPPWLHRIPDFGFDIQMIGTSCYIVAVKPGSDAEVKGLKVGDRVHAVIIPQGALEPTRTQLWQIRLICTLLMPTPSIEVDVQSPGGQIRAVKVDGKLLIDKSKFSEPEKEIPKLVEQYRPHFHRYSELDAETYYWRKDNQPVGCLCAGALDTPLEKSSPPEVETACYWGLSEPSANNSRFA